jgi:carbon starvation protein
MIVVVVVVSVIVLAAGYRLYGSYLSRRLGLEDSRATPACEVNDGLDYVPARKSMLLAQHFSAISAAGPIVGPILAGIWFGWLPALVWIVLGSIFVGGTHDFTSLVASVRHKATSIGELARQYMSRTSQIIYLVFVWFALVYVIIAFTDITAQTFKTVAAGTAPGPGVAASSFLYLLMGVTMGIVLRKFKVKLWIVTAVAVPLLALFIWWGTRLPAPMVEALLKVPVKTWEVVLLAYCFIASLLPMWLLLQPRGYLGGWFLYLTMASALFGALFGGHLIQYPALNLEGLASPLNGKLLFPMVFITVACGACSGFHGIVSAGTTSKQIAKESDTRPVAYGSMILEAVVAILALATVMMLPKGDPLLQSDPNFIFATGISGYLGTAGVGTYFALSFALLAFSTFVYDTLDVCTRLARYILQELFGWKSFAGAVGATAITLSLPLAFLLLTKEKGYLVAWPVFGISNQLLASLTLLAVSIWLLRTGRRAMFAILPMFFMLVFTLWALGLQIKPFLLALPVFGGAGAIKPDVMISGICGVVLLVLSVWLMIEAARVLSTARAGAAGARKIQPSAR